MTAAPVKKPAIPLGSKEPVLICPFTGKLIDIVFSPGAGAYMARGPFWTSSLYKDKQELLHDISHRMGVAPQFSRKVTVKVREVEEPEPNPNADLVVKDVMGDK
jgi:hypothetical protein